jgi:hypothetical protein
LFGFHFLRYGPNGQKDDPKEDEELHQPGNDNTHAIRRTGKTEDLVRDRETHDVCVEEQSPDRIRAVSAKVAEEKETRPEDDLHGHGSNERNQQCLLHRHIV